IRRSQASVATLSIDAGDDPVTGGSALAAGVPARSGVHVVQVVLLDRLCGQGTVDEAFLGERLERANDDRRAVDLEEATCCGARVREPEAVGAEGGVPLRDPRTDLVL